MAATISTNANAAVDPNPPNGETTFHHDKQACRADSTLVLKWSEPGAHGHKQTCHKRITL